MLTNPNSGGWATYDQITHTQMNGIGTQLPYAIDGNAGGTYNPSAFIQIGGSGLRLSAGLLVTAGTVTFTPLVTFNGNVAAAGAVAIANTLDVTGAHATTLGGTLAVTGATTLAAMTASGTAQFGGAFQTTSSAVCAAGLTVSGGAFQIGSGSSGNAIAQEVQLSGAGRIRERVSNLTDADATVDCTTADVFVMRASVPSATRNIKLATTGASVGSTIEITNYDTIHTLAVQNDSGGAIITLPVSASHGLGGIAPSFVRMRWLDDHVSAARWSIASYVVGA